MAAADGPHCDANNAILSRSILPSGIEAPLERVPGGSEFARNDEYDLDRAV